MLSGPLVFVYSVIPTTVKDLREIQHLLPQKNYKVMSYISAGFVSVEWKEMGATGQAAKSCTAKRTKQDKQTRWSQIATERFANCTSETTKVWSEAGSCAPAELLNSGGIEQLSRWRVEALPARAGIRSLTSHHTR